jgi:hypothetical protein
MPGVAPQGRAVGLARSLGVTLAHESVAQPAGGVGILGHGLRGRAQQVHGLVPCLPVNPQQAQVVGGHTGSRLGCQRPAQQRLGFVGPAFVAQQRPQVGERVDMGGMGGHGRTQVPGGSLAVAPGQGLLRELELAARLRERSGRRGRARGLQRGWRRRRRRGR